MKSSSVSLKRKFLPSSETDECIQRFKRLKLSPEPLFGKIPNNALEKIALFSKTKEQGRLAQTKKVMNKAVISARSEWQESLEISSDSDIYSALKAFIHPSGSTTLKKLVINHHLGLDAETLEFISINFPSLEYLDIDFSPNLAGEPLLNFPKNLKTLRLNFYDINTGFAEPITDDVLRCLPITLTSLFLSDCFEITNNGVDSLLKMQELANLELDSNYLTREALARLAILPLEVFTVIMWENFTNGDLRFVAENFKSLTSFKISCCECITDDGLFQLAEMPVKSLYLEQLDNITDHGIGYLKDLPMREIVVENCINVLSKETEFMNLTIKETRGV